MEVLNLLIKRHISLSTNFKYHWQCKELKITHICFADDLLLFCHGDSKSVSILKSALDDFRAVFGLLPSMPKSTVFFGNVKDAAKSRILKVMRLTIGTLPVRYLGVPLISNRLFSKDCQLLIDKVRRRIMDWKNKTLSFASRLQLISSIIGSMQIYWSSMFILPDSISHDVKRLMRDFLWNFGIFKRGKAKVKWSDMCKLKVEGGLGIRSLEDWNIHCSGLSMNSKIADVIDMGRWIWPKTLTDMFDGLLEIDPPSFDNGKANKVMWKKNAGKNVDFAISKVWHDIRKSKQAVP
ncbi:hypothetical protein Tco_0889511 [Tanacetum coccineum]